MNIPIPNKYTCGETSGADVVTDRQTDTQTNRRNFIFISIDHKIRKKECRVKTLTLSHAFVLDWPLRRRRRRRRMLNVVYVTGEGRPIVEKEGKR